MDGVVLLIFAIFFTGLVIATTNSDGRLRTSVRRPRLFRLAVIGAATATVPLDLYAVIYGTAGPGQAALADVTGRLLLLNVAASCGVAALHGFLRERVESAVLMGVLGWIGPLMALGAVTAVVALGSGRNAPELGNVGSVWACYSLLICVISGYALTRRRVRIATGPQEG
jgi:hypothetical protein